MHSNLFAGKRLTLRCSRVGMLDHQLADGVTAKRTTRWSREQWMGGFPAALIEPRSQDGHGVAGERSDALFAPFAVDPHMSAVTKDHVSAAQPSQLGHP